MKLLTSKVSPFVRTVDIVSHELGLYDDIAREPTAASITEPNRALQAISPLRKIPTLVLEDGTAIVDSSLIARYLAARVGDTHLFAEGSPEHWPLMTRYLWAKGIIECALLARYEVAMRPPERRWDVWVEDQMDKVEATLAYFDANPPQAGGRLTIFDVALGVALEYLDFRFADLKWRDRHATLAEWLVPIASRPSFKATVPVA